MGTVYHPVRCVKRVLEAVRRAAARQVAELESGDSGPKDFVRKGAKIVGARPPVRTRSVCHFRYPEVLPTL